MDVLYDVDVFFGRDLVDLVPVAVVVSEVEDYS